MKNYAIIAEYNPFHFGHLYQINMIRKMDPKAVIIVIISTFFVQRGEPSYLDPKFKTASALKNGADLVLALPSIYSLQSAEHFAYGAVSILNRFKHIDHLVFGAESDYSELYNFARFQMDNAPSIDEKRIEFMKEGLNFNQGLIKACCAIADENDMKISQDLFQSNNILALEYIKSLIKLKSSISAISIKRSGQRYNDTEILEEKLPSATAIRKHFKEAPGKVKNILPKESYSGLIQSRFIDKNTLFDLIKYKLIIESIPLETITGFEQGLSGHLRKNLMKSSSYDEFIENSTTSRYRKNRIQRFIINMLLDNKKVFIDQSIREIPEWVRVLGFNKKGQDFLHSSKNESDMIFLTQYKQYNALSDFGKKQFDKEVDSCNLYYFSKDNFGDYFRQIPIIIKD